MPFDSFVMAAVAWEIRRRAMDGQVVKIHQPSEDEAIVRLRAGSRPHRLVLNIHAERFGVYFQEKVPDNPPSPPAFCMALRKHLEGSRLIAVEQEGLERVLRLRFRRSDGERLLAAEMMGKHSNLVLVDERGVILDAMKRVSRRVNRARELLPNRPYLPPPPSERPDPLLSSEEAVLRALEDSLKRSPEKGAGGAGRSGRVTAVGMVKALSGIGPFAAAEILAEAEATIPGDAEPGWPDDPPGDRSGAASAARALAERLGRVRRGAFEPALILDGEGRPGDVWAFRCRTVPSDRQESAPGMSEALEVRRLCRAGPVDIDRRRRDLLPRVIARREREERRLAEALAAREEAERADEFRVRGELILANAMRIERGAAEADLIDYFDPELPVVRAPLDPTLSPRENAEACFRRHRKAKSGLPMLVERAAAVAGERDRWAAMAAEIETAPEERLREIEALLEPAERPGQGPEREAAGERAAREEEPRRPGPGVRRVLSSDGMEIWYGENREGNDLLTTRLSDPNDLWLHVRAGASAHVVIRTGRKPDEVPRRTLEEAARIAVAHSDSKHAGVTPVDVTLRKHVRKPRGSGSGKALYTHEKTLHVEGKE